MIEIKVAPEESKEQIWQLYLDYAVELSEYDHEPRPRKKEHYEGFDAYWEDLNRTAFLVLFDHTPIGFCMIQDTGLSYKIDEFYIHPLHRCRGFGKAAVEYVKDYCRQHGRHKVMEAHIYVNNEPALKFWQKLGFRDTGRRTRVKNLRLIETEAELTENAAVV